MVNHCLAFTTIYPCLSSSNKSTAIDLLPMAFQVIHGASVVLLLENFCTCYRYCT